MVVVADAPPRSYVAVNGHIGLPSVCSTSRNAIHARISPRHEVSRPDWLYLQSPRPDSFALVSPDLNHEERAATALAAEVKGMIDGQNVLSQLRGRSSTSMRTHSELPSNDSLGDLACVSEDERQTELTRTPKPRMGSVRPFHGI